MVCHLQTPLCMLNSLALNWDIKALLFQRKGTPTKEKGIIPKVHAPKSSQLPAQTFSHCASAQ